MAKGLTPKTRRRERERLQHQLNQLTRLALWPPEEPSDDPIAALEAAEAEYRAWLAEYWRDRDPLTGQKLTPEPEPEPAPDYLAQAYELARAKMDGDPQQAARLDKAHALARSGAVKALGGGQYQVNGYAVNGRCECGDYQWNSAYNGGWCKHRLAVALVVKAQKMEAGSADDTPAPEAPMTEDPTQDQDTTERAARQAAAALDGAEALSWAGPWTRPTAEILVNGRWQAVTVPWAEAEAEAQRRGWPWYARAYHRPPAGGA